MAPVPMDLSMSPRPLAALALAVLLAACASAPDTAAPPAASPKPAAPPPSVPEHLRELSGQLLGVPSGAEVEWVTFDLPDAERALPKVAYHLDTPATWSARWRQ